MQKMKYSFRVDLPVDFETALTKTTVALQGEGFGVLTQIDVRQALKEKLDVGFRRYQILGVYNPPLAHQALLADEDAGLLLPCNVIIAEMEDGRTRIAAVNPMAEMQISDSRRLQTIAGDLGDKLQRVVRQVEDRLTRTAQSVPITRPKPAGVVPPTREQPGSS